jgi:AbrB family looped-hinge helix DNA binding protein
MLGGQIEVGMARVDEKGRVLIPLEERLRAGLQPGVELEVTQEKEGLFLRPLVPKPLRVRSGRKWGKETFPDAGEATFGVSTLERKTES